MENYYDMNNRITRNNAIKSNDKNDNHNHYQQLTPKYSLGQLVVMQFRSLCMPHCLGYTRNNVIKTNDKNDDDKGECERKNKGLRKLSLV